MSGAAGMTLGSWLALAGAGGLGAMSRYAVYRAVAPAEHGAFPVATVVVNVVGSLLFGLVVVLADEGQLFGTRTRTILLAGFLGAFTTFSTFAFETAELLRLGHTGRALLNALAQNCGAVLGVFGGIALGRLLAD